MPAGIINTGSHPKALWPGVHDWWGQIFAEHPPEYTDLFDIETSDKAYEQAVQITPFGLAPVKSQGAGVTYDGEVQGAVTTYQHIAYALGLVLAHDGGVSKARRHATHYTIGPRPDRARRRGYVQ